MSFLQFYCWCWFIICAWVFPFSIEWKYDHWILSSILSGSTLHKLSKWCSLKLHLVWLFLFVSSLCFSCFLHCTCVRYGASTKFPFLELVFCSLLQLDPPASGRTSSGPSRKMLLTPKDLSFVGYTYKNFDAVKGLRSLDLKRSLSAKQPSIGSIFSESAIDNTNKRTAEETEVQMLASSGDPMLP